MLLRDRNVVFITLDSCRFDVAASAATPHLDALSPLVRAETPGTYTLPAHVAYFNGFLPQPEDGRYWIDGIGFKSIWRSAAARQTSSAAGITFAGRTVMDHYRAVGYRVIGAGGVTFFDPSSPLNLLPTFFPEFHYYGRPVGGPAGGPADRDEVLALSHVDELARECLLASRYFLFINCASTHIPYTTPAARLDPALTELLRRLYRLHDAKSADGDLSDITASEAQQLRRVQGAALEWADVRLGALFDQLRRTEPLVVVCADHGEEFGDGGRYGHGHPHHSVTTVPMWVGVLR
jgi:hypothetical protein